MFVDLRLIYGDAGYENDDRLTVKLRAVDLSMFTWFIWYFWVDVGSAVED